MASKKFLFLFSMLLSMVGTKAFAYDFSLENADGVTIYYNYINDGKELEVTYKQDYNPNSSYSGIVDIPEEVTYENKSLKVTRIGDCAFYNSQDMTSVTIPNSVTRIGQAAFSGCIGLTTVIIPNSVTSIAVWAFEDCWSLTSVTISDSITSIENYTFLRCMCLNSVTIPSSVTSIGDYAFQGCDFISLTIPNSVTSIGQFTFRDCNSLISVTIPNSLKTIGEHAFFECANLIEIISKIENPFEINTSTFNHNTYSKATLYVPSGTIDLYKATGGWMKFAFIEEMGTPTYKLTYIVDGEEYKSYDVKYGASITPEPEPSKEGYTFSGWSDIPATMPANDVTVTGSFSINKYKLIYKLDGQLYKSYDIEYGSKITPEPDPTKDGYTFSGWSDIPKTMPAKDVTVTGSFIKNEVPEQDEITQDNILYRIDRGYASVIKADNVSGDIKIEASIVINGMTYEVNAIAKKAFKGCTEITSVEIPNSIVTIGDKAFDGCTALHLIKIGSGVKEIEGRAFANISKSYAGTRSDDNSLHIYFDAESVPTTDSGAFEDTDIANATLHVRDDMVNTFKAFNPWSNFGTIIGFSDTSIRTINIDTSDALIFDMHGNRLNYPRKGVNIIRMNNGKTKKLIVK